MAQLLPSEIAEQLHPMEMSDLVYKVAKKYDQTFGIIKISRYKWKNKNKADKVRIEVELADNTRHQVVI